MTEIYRTEIYKAVSLLALSNFMVGTVMSLVYYLGKESIYSSLLIYGPVSLISVVLIRDNYSKPYLFSNILAICHGIAHLVFPFLNEHIGVNKEIDVWQDQIVHLLQATLFASLFFNNSGSKFKILSILFVMANVLNVLLGYYCWGEQCHNLYVWVSLSPALASGLHFATGTLFQQTREVAKLGFMIQGTSSIITFFLFKSSDDMLKLFALCRFFEVYFIASHYIGFFYGRYQKSQQKKCVPLILETLGIYSNSDHNKQYFAIEKAC